MLFKWKHVLHISPRLTLLIHILSLVVIQITGCIYRLLLLLLNSGIVLNKWISSLFFIMMVMPSSAQWAGVQASSGSWWWTGKLGMLQSMGSQRFGHDWVTELNWTELNGLSCPEASGILVPRPGIKPESPALEGGFLTTEPPGEPPRCQCLMMIII